MNTHIAVLAFISLLFSGCDRAETDVQLPSWEISARRFMDEGRVNGYEWILNIDKDGRYVMHERSYETDQALSEELARFRPSSPHTAILIRADRRTPHASVMRALLMMEEAGFATVSLAVRDPHQPLIEGRLRLTYK
jgi:biopolymer transport protein ExbD